MSFCKVFVLAFALGILVAPSAAEAQQPARVPRVGVLAYGAGPEVVDRFREGLRQLGYVEGQNIAIEIRNAEGKSERLPGLATDLVRLKVDIIVSQGSTATRAAKEATATIPIVMAPGDDPVRMGFVASFARPGGNITGVSTLSGEAGAKRLQLLKETVPKLTRVAVLSVPVNPGHRPALKEIEVPARSLGVQLRLAEARDPDELDRAFAGMANARVGAVLVLGDSVFYSQRRRIVDLAARSGLPAMYFRKEFVEAGGLMSYATNVADVERRAAYYVDKILKGAKPADLPVEQPTRFELVVNMKTAKALGLTFPQSILVRADQVIQ